MVMLGYRKVFFFLFFAIRFFSFAAAEVFPADDAMVIKSGEAQYDGKEIFLSGKVVVEHGLGHIFAGNFSIKPCEGTEKKSRFSLLTMDEDVRVVLPAGGTLECQHAAVDYSRLKGEFQGSADVPDVVYTDFGPIEPSSESVPLLVMKSGGLNIELLRDSDSKKTVVKEIESIDDVRVCYRGDYNLFADRAVFRCFGVHGSLIPPGILTLEGKGIDSFCSLTTANADSIRAKRIIADTNRRCLFLERPSGILRFAAEQKEPSVLEFTSDSLSWSELEQVLSLEGKVSLFYNRSVKVETDRLDIGITTVDGKRRISFIKAPEKTEMTYADVQKRTEHKIICPGAFKMDDAAQEIVLEGISLEGISSESGSEDGVQVCLEDRSGKMYADRVIVRYKRNEGRILPLNVLSDGKVRLSGGSSEDPSAVVRYAVADRAECFLEDGEIVLSGRENRQVLLFDHANRVRMSAASLKILRDPLTGKESIRGVGDVRFTFMDCEAERMKKCFRIEGTEI